MECLKLPVNFKAIMDKGSCPKCSVDYSIKQHLHLMLTSYQGELKSSTDFGNQVWEDDFLHVRFDNEITSKIKSSLIQNIHQFEKRLLVEAVDIQHYYEENHAGAHRLKRRVDIYIEGVNVVDQTAFKHHEHFYIAPLSY